MQTDMSEITTITLNASRYVDLNAIAKGTRYHDEITMHTRAHHSMWVIKYVTTGSTVVTGWHRRSEPHAPDTLLWPPLILLMQAKP